MTMRDGELEELGVRLADEVKAVVARPGDTLVITMTRRITEQEYHDLDELMGALLPQGLKILVIPEAGDIRVFRPEGGDM